MKQFDLQGNEYDIQIKSMLNAMPKDIESCTIHFTEKDLLKSFREEALRHRKEIERLKSRLEEYQEYVEINHKEIERLNNVINEFEDILKRDIKACNNKFENMFDRNYRRLILEEKLEELQELKGSDKE